jgi:hypothetical protein
MNRSHGVDSGGLAANEASPASGLGSCRSVGCDDSGEGTRSICSRAIGGRSPTLRLSLKNSGSSGTAWCRWQSKQFPKVLLAFRLPAVENRGVMDGPAGACGRLARADLLQPKRLPSRHTPNTDPVRQNDATKCYECYKPRLLKVMWHPTFYRGLLMIEKRDERERRIGTAQYVDGSALSSPSSLSTASSQSQSADPAARRRTSAAWRAGRPGCP